MGIVYLVMCVLHGLTVAEPSEIFMATAFSVGSLLCLGQAILDKME